MHVTTLDRRVTCLSPLHEPLFDFVLLCVTKAERFDVVAVRIPANSDMFITVGGNDVFLVIRKCLLPASKQG